MSIKLKTGTIEVYKNGEQIVLDTLSTGGSSVTVTEEELNSIAESAAEKLQPSIDELKNNKLDIKRIEDVSTTDPKVVIENKWTELSNGYYIVDTATKTYNALIYKNTDKWGSVTIQGYGTSNPIYGTIDNSIWTWTDTVVKSDPTYISAPTNMIDASVDITSLEAGIYYINYNSTPTGGNQIPIKSKITDGLLIINSDTAYKNYFIFCFDGKIAFGQKKRYEDTIAWHYATLTMTTT